ncbi:MAG: hypothetical protein ACI9LN_003881, partial [Saprospiraceae bacterium]
DYFPFKKLKNAFNRRTIKGFFKFLKQKISSVKSVDYLRSPTYKAITINKMFNLLVVIAYF